MSKLRKGCRGVRCQQQDLPSAEHQSMIYQSMGHYQDAAKAYEGALSRFRHEGDSGRFLTCLATLGNLYRELGTKTWPWRPCKRLGASSQRVIILRTLGTSGTGWP